MNVTMPRAARPMSLPNQEIRLRMNEDRFRIFHDVNREIAFICECADPECHRTVVLTAAEYESVRPDRILDPAHRSA
jgi:hypothetical protein